MKQSKGGRPRLEDPPYLDEALPALVKDCPKVRQQIIRHHIEFVVRFVRERGAKIADIYRDGECVNEALEKRIRRRIEDWLEAHPSV